MAPRPCSAEALSAQTESVLDALDRNRTTRALVRLDDWLLAMAMAALGLGTVLGAIRRAGLRPMLLAGALAGARRGAGQPGVRALSAALSSAGRTLAA